MTTSAEAIARLDAVEVPVYHGTRVSAAIEIQRDGFRPVAVSDMLQQVTESYGVSVDDLRADLEHNGRFATSKLRTSQACVTGDRDRAARYASRGPEARWEALWAIFRLRHGIGFDWNDSGEGHLWVLSQDIEDGPVVVEAITKLGALRSATGGTASESIVRAIERGEDVADALRFDLEKTPEWLVAPDDLTFRAAELAPFRIDHRLMVFMSGTTIPEFEEQLRTGFWGDAGGWHPLMGEWYPYQQIWERLPAQRRAHLERLVGKALEPRWATSG